MERKRVDQIEDECEETLSRIDRLIRDGGSSDRIQALHRKLNIVIAKLEKEVSTDLITGMKNASQDRLSRIKARKDALIERLNSKASFGNKILPDVAEERDELISSPEEETPHLATLMNIKSLSANIHVKVKSLAEGLNKDTQKIQGALDINDQMSSNLRKSEQFTNGALRYVAIHKLYLILLIVLLGMVDIGYLTYKLYAK